MNIVEIGPYGQTELQPEPLRGVSSAVLPILYEQYENKKPLICCISHCNEWAGKYIMWAATLHHNYVLT